MPDTLLGLEWETNARPQIQFTLVQMHGDADAFTSKTLSFPDTQGGHQQAQLALQAIPLLSDAIDADRDASLEAYCAKTARKLPAGTATEEDLEKLFKDVVVCDCTCEDYTAAWVGLVVERTTPSGLQRALFNVHGTSMRYLPLSSVHPSYLKPWA